MAPQDISDEQLIAWLCGESTAEVDASIEAGLAEDIGLSQRVLDLSATLAQVGQAIQEPAPVSGLTPASGSIPTIASASSPRFSPKAAILVSLLFTAATWLLMVGIQRSGKVDRQQELTAWVIRLDPGDEDESLTADGLGVLSDAESENLNEDSWLSTDVYEPASWLAVAVRESQLGESQRGGE